MATTADEAIQNLISHWRWASGEGRGGADTMIRVRDAAQKDGYGRAATEAERALQEGNEALLRLASALRERSLSGDVPAGVKLPQWRTDRPAPTLDPQRTRREQQIGYALALAACASQLQEAAGGEA